MTLKRLPHNRGPALAGGGFRKFDPHRRVIARMVAAAHLAVDTGSNKAARNRGAQQQMIDA